MDQLEADASIPDATPDELLEAVMGRHPHAATDESD